MKPKTLIIGGNGSIGRRYQAISRHLGERYDVFDQVGSGAFDLKKVYLDGFRRAIIASPTETHVGYCDRLVAAGVPFLCEKPLSQSVEDCERLVSKDGFVVNNYAFLTQKYSYRPHLKYDYFHTGKDGILWDCAQIIYLDPHAEIRTESPFWNFKVDYQWVSYRDLEQSYVDMIRAFLADNVRRLWTLEDGLKMTRAVLGRGKKDDEQRTKNMARTSNMVADQARNPEVSRGYFGDV